MIHPKSPQLLALKSAERFIQAELEVRRKSYLPNPTEAEAIDLDDALECYRIVQDAIVKGEIAWEKECQL
jgi:hypothetical protein